jgi:DNA repair protein RadC
MTKIKDIPKINRPREKLEKYGISKLDDVELLALTLGSGIKGLNVIALSRSVLKEVRRVGVGNADMSLLSNIKGLGKVKAGQLMAALELGIRLSKTDIPVMSVDDVWVQCADFSSSKKEHTVAFYLDTQSRLIERQVISVGILDTSLIHPREVFEPAIRLSAASVILVHNHPSGDLEPSPEDFDVTERLKNSSEILGIDLLDHIIVSKKGYVSIISEMRKVERDLK